jgi:hypothetical protein
MQFPVDYGAGMHLRFVVRYWYLLTANVTFQIKGKQTTDLNRTTIPQKLLYLQTADSNSLAVRYNPFNSSILINTQ